MRFFDFSKIPSFKLNIGQRSYLTYVLILTTVSSLSLGVSIFTNWIISSYFNINVPGSLMFRGDDGWCNAKDEGFGIHCFGDFNERFNVTELPHLRAYPNNLELTPLGPFITFVANSLASIANPRSILLLFYFLSICLILLPLIISTWRLPWIFKILGISVFGIGSYPFLVLIDRLNYLVFAVPLLYFLYSKLDRNDFFSSGLILILLTAIKPQFCLLVLIFLFRGEKKKFLQIVLSQILFVTGLIVLAGRGSFSRIFEYIQVASGYAYSESISAWDLQSRNPPNASLARVFFLIINFFLDVLGLQNNFDATFLKHLATSCSLLIFLLIISLLYFKRHALNDLEIGLILTVLALLCLGIYVAGYYLVFIIPILAVFLRRISFLPHIDGDNFSFNLGFDVAFKEFVVAFFFSTTTIILPSFSEGILRLPNTNVLEILSPTFATLAWIIFSIKLLIKRKINLVR